MKFNPLTIAALLGLTTAAPTLSLEERYPTNPSLIKPIYNNVYSRSTGGLTYNPALDSSIFDKTTTISTFNLPSALKGRKCRLGFVIDAADTKATLTSATGVQLFSTNSVPPTYDVKAWGPPGNQRNIHYGNLNLKKPGEGGVDDWPRLLEKFDCPTGYVAWEIAAKWNVGVEWDPVKSGLYVVPL